MFQLSYFLLLTKKVYCPAGTFEFSGERRNIPFQCSDLFGLTCESPSDLSSVFVDDIDETQYYCIATRQAIETDFRLVKLKKDHNNVFKITEHIHNKDQYMRKSTRLRTR